mmetsp:Transcript_53845/g.149465  ORF Transcript_53845/g.149465 Transcript_53845/m.149465 type:complete len:236 (+) Transcript_53845:458-1165(+)
MVALTPPRCVPRLLLSSSLSRRESRFGASTRRQRTESRFGGCTLAPTSSASLSAHGSWPWTSDLGALPFPRLPLPRFAGACSSGRSRRGFSAAAGGPRDLLPDGDGIWWVTTWLHLDCWSSSPSSSSDADSTSSSSAVSEDEDRSKCSVTSKACFPPLHQSAPGASASFSASKLGTFLAPLTYFLRLKASCLRFDTPSVALLNHAPTPRLRSGAKQTSRSALWLKNAIQGKGAGA